jgi:N-acetylglucosamine kinase-like BadF-type ATPase
MAAHEAGVELPLTGAWFGLAGVDRPGDREALLPGLAGLATTFELTNDANLVLTALPGAVGVAAIAGTGSIAFGRDLGGAATRSGGWGHIIGDEGSGYDLGRQALQAVTRAHDGRGPATELVRAILDHWRLPDPTRIVDRVYHGGGDDKAEIAKLATLVCATARGGDAVARRLVETAAGELALAIVAVADRLTFDGPMPLALAGGLLTGEAELRDAVVADLAGRRPIGPVEIVHEPATSAARAAIELAFDQRPTSS